MLDYNLFKPIRNFGLLILVVGVSGLLCLVAFHNDPDFYFGAKFFPVSFLLSICLWVAILYQETD